MKSMDPGNGKPQKPHLNYEQHKTWPVWSQKLWVKVLSHRIQSHSRPPFLPLFILELHFELPLRKSLSCSMYELRELASAADDEDQTPPPPSKISRQDGCW